MDEVVGELAILSSLTPCISPRVSTTLLNTSCCCSSPSQASLHTFSSLPLTSAVTSSRDLIFSALFLACAAGVEQLACECCVQLGHCRWRGGLSVYAPLENLCNCVSSYRSVHGSFNAGVKVHIIHKLGFTVWFNLILTQESTELDF